MINLPLREKISKQWLFPSYFKMLGLTLILLSLILAVVRFYYNIRLPFFESTWFAIYSMYIDTKFFSPITTSFSEEIPALLLLLGLLFVAFSREKNENEGIHNLRISSFFISIYITVLIQIMAILFTFGLAFMNVLIFNMYSFWIVYIIVFSISKMKLKRSENENRMKINSISS